MSDEIEAVEFAAGGRNADAQQVAVGIVGQVAVVGARGAGLRGDDVLAEGVYGVVEREFDGAQRRGKKDTWPCSALAPVQGLEEELWGGVCEEDGQVLVVDLGQDGDVAVVALAEDGAELCADALADAELGAHVELVHDLCGGEAQQPGAGAGGLVAGVGGAEEGDDVRVDLADDEVVDVEQLGEARDGDVGLHAAVDPGGVGGAGDPRDVRAGVRVLCEQRDGAEDQRQRARGDDGGPDEDVRRRQVVEQARHRKRRRARHADVEDAARAAVALLEGDVAQRLAHDAGEVRDVEPDAWRLVGVLGGAHRA
ncbi:hypothetical protein NEOLI_004336 [Neolecta irregularis DAH-3]|uniref:Uncharacterized protein n=1 Tax=Neolecta irregularis (strain DAH-3) TaxID=1198029 RepID=A0A1U7LM05_NEOID|nr:hypothetical protein NEOLI_004336 [Neolecta irregularis DAH-3]|eukprot:OLL23696.1 hypothetical protein NEOLI_004336 [Neolecta irregularis DAH-3]